jgi:hypothetical protein
MGRFIGDLTKTGLQSQGGPGASPSTTFFNSPADAMNQANATLSKQAGPSLVNAPPGGALDAHNGPDHPSAFGLGWGAAKMMPLQRAASRHTATATLLQRHDCERVVARIEGQDS